MSAKWDGGKCKGAGHAKAVLRHCDKECREITKEHENEFIDKNLTKHNFDLLNRSYEEKAKFYDERIEQLSENSLIRKNSVTMQEICIYPPDNFPEKKLNEFFQESMEALAELFGKENLVNADVHYDEVHRYFDAETKEYKWSKPHLHLGFIPEVEGRLCGKEFYSRKNIYRVNSVLDRMCKADFGISFLSGKGKEDRKHSFDEQKKVSTDLMMEIREDLTQINENLTKENKSLSADNKTLKKEQKQIQDKNRNLKAEKKVLEEKSERLSLECRELQEDLDSLASECSKVQSEVSELKKAKQQLRSECEKLQGYARKALTDSERAMFREIKERHPEMVEQVREEVIEGYNRLNSRVSGRNTSKGTDISPQL